MSGVRPITPAILRSYRLSVYSAGGVSVRVGRIARRNMIEGANAAILLSACNPGGRRRPDGWNRRMMERLEEALHGMPTATGEGRLGGWSEPLFAVDAPLARGMRLARMFRQNAVVLVKMGRRTRLVFLAPMSNV
ncbi:DUF3293 domain-containing protein [Acetobacter sacchari]|uniref:DUF3293 domain-containing protein n=1 Tax=Acetobacter sacchari TaxID=2661687 RepID=A0ABS3LZ29_9PROT|nr:DUF3293 domain-containing protein [Acetobacter sacchari]MBO1361169.1 DUF3293 domain-containing protein [Acetobacter sacchari]